MTESVYSDEELERMYREAFHFINEKEYEKAVELLRKVADNGCTNALWTLGRLYERGTGVPQSYEEAVRLYEIAAKNGCCSAQSRLGHMYMRGEGVPESLDKAIEWYEMAIKGGNPSDYNDLAYIYSLKGKTDPKYYEVAARLWKASAEQGDRNAQYNLARMYEDGIGVQQSYDEAIRWYEEIIDGEENVIMFEDAIEGIMRIEKITGKR